MTTTTIKTAVVREDKETYTYDFEMGEVVCNHDNAYIEKACCSSVGESGYYECGCGGRDSVVCENKDCTGITDEEVETLFERLR